MNSKLCGLVALSLTVGCLPMPLSNQPAGVRDRDPAQPGSAADSAGVALSSHSTDSVTITGLFPSQAKVGDTITIAGTNFSDTPASNSVVFAGATATPTAADIDSLSVVVPSGASSGLLRVDVGSLSSNRFFFTVESSALPVISGIYPTSSAPGTRVTILGSGFSPSPLLNEVFFGPVAATVVTATPNGLIVEIPSLATTSEAYVLTGGNYSNRVNFVVPPAVSSIFPDRGTPGQSVTISGSNFGSSTGSVSVAGSLATVESWSDTEIKTSIPPLSQAGPIEVTSAGGALTSFNGFGVLSGGLDPAHSAWTRFTTPHLAGWVARIGRYIYQGGGTSGAYPPPQGYTTVERALLNQDGTLGSFSQVQGVTMTSPAAFNGPFPEPIGNYVYAFGGRDSSGATLGTYQRATVNADSSITTFATVGSLATPSEAHYSLRVRNTLYLFGGWNPTSGPMNAYQKAAINADGTLGAFTLVSNPFPYTAYGGVPVETGDYVYIFGGSPNANPSPISNVMRAPILDSQGNLGTFAQESRYLAQPLYFGGAVTLDRTLFLFWGVNAGPNLVSSVYRGFITPGGDLQTPAPYTNLFLAHYRPVPIAYGGRVFVDGELTVNNANFGANWQKVGPFAEMPLIK